MSGDEEVANSGSGGSNPVNTSSIDNDNNTGNKTSFKSGCQTKRKNNYVCTESKTENPSVPVSKVKRQLTQQQLENLRLGREKALEARMKKKQRLQEYELKDEVEKAVQAALDSRVPHILDKIKTEKKRSGSKVPTKVPPVQAKKRITPVPVQESESQSETEERESSGGGDYDDDESDEEEEEDDDDESENDVQRRRRHKPVKKSRGPPAKKIKKPKLVKRQPHRAGSGVHPSGIHAHLLTSPW